MTMTQDKDPAILVVDQKEDGTVNGTVLTQPAPVLARGGLGAKLR